MVNKANIEKLIEAIEDETKTFDMNSYRLHIVELRSTIENRFSHVDEREREKNLRNLELMEKDKMCQSPACVCGWANMLGENTVQLQGQRPDVLYCDELFASEWMGIPYEDGMRLFMSTELSREEVLVELRRMIA